MKPRYRPLPKELTIKPSIIEGLGLFTTEDLPAEHDFGITHIQDDRFVDCYIRTPLGGFFNHSDNPNCEAYQEGDFIKLKTIIPIKCGEELTAWYWLYDMERMRNEADERYS